MHSRTVACVVAGLALSPATAVAAGGSEPGFPDSSLSLSVAGPRQAQQALTIIAAGTNAPRTPGARAHYGLDLIVTDPAILPGGCETTEQAEVTRLSTVHDGGLLLTYSELDEGAGGQFRVREPYEPMGSGPLQVCGYSELRHADAAWAQVTVRVTPVPRPPRALGRPRIVRRGTSLVCLRPRFSGAPTRFSFRWRVGDERFGPPRASDRLRVTRRDRGVAATCRVLAHAAGGTASATSATVSIVEDDS